MVAASCCWTWRRLRGDERVVVDTGAEPNSARHEHASVCSGEAEAVTEQRYVVGVHLDGDRSTVDLALTLAQSLAYDNGDRSRAITLARMRILHEAPDRVSVSFIVGPSRTRADAVESLRTDLGLAALDLASRHWGEQAQLLRALSASAK